MPEANLNDEPLFIDTVLQYHLSIPDPDALPLWEWAGKYAILLTILESERKESSA